MFRLRFFIKTMPLLALLVATSSCKKDDDEPTDPSSQKSVVTEYLDSRSASPESFTVNGSTTNTLTTTGGTQLYIPAGAFKDANGNAVTGNVDFEVIEIFEKSDMVKSARPTTSDGKVLVSGGEFKFTATANGENLQLTDSGDISVTVPTTSFDPSMSLWTGGEDSLGQFNWEEIFGSGMDSVQQGSNYFFDIDTLTWINIDKFYNVTNTTLTINLEAGFTTDKAQTFIVFNNLNSVLMPSTYQGDINTASYVQNLIPVGESITIVCLAEKDGNLYLAEEDLTTVTNGSVNLTFTQMTEAEVDAILDSLDD